MGEFSRFERVIMLTNHGVYPRPALSTVGPLLPLNRYERNPMFSSSAISDVDELYDYQITFTPAD